jgi:hypothetical protein
MEVVDIDNHILKFVLDNTNPVNRNVYIEAYSTLARDNNLLDLDDKIIYLMNRVESLDPNYIPLGISTIFSEIFRNVFTKMGVVVRWDIILRDSLSLYDLLVEIRDHDNIVDILKDISIDSFDLFNITDKLDLEVISLFEYITSYDLFKENLYAIYKEEILTAIDYINT